MTQRLRLPSVAVLLAAVALASAVYWWRAHNVGAVQRGARLAASRGCLACHGTPGRLADPDGSRGIGTVPSFEHDDVTAYARSADEIREWILDGRPKRLDDPPGEPGATGSPRPRSMRSSPG
jgi:hypothetical protein